LHEENEIIVKLGDESVDRVWIFAVFEVVEGNAGSETDELENEGIVSEVWKLDQEVDGEGCCKDSNGWKLPFVGGFVSEDENVEVCVDCKNEGLSDNELCIWETEWLLSVSTLSPGKDWVNHKAIEVESHQEPQPRHLHDQLGPHLHIVNAKVILNVLSIWSSKLFIILSQV
jgi:hypothetical protein